MILESVEHGLLIWPTIEENGVTMTKKYVELSPTKKIQADCDMKAINIILQGLPIDIYSLVNHHRVAKDLWEKVQLLMQGTSLTKQERECKLFMHHLEQHELHANEVRLMRERNQDPLALVVNHQMTPPHFNTYQSSYNNPQFQQQFSPSQSHQYGSTHPTQHYSTTYSIIPTAITYPSSPDNQHASTHQLFHKQCLKPKRKRDAMWSGEKVLLVRSSRKWLKLLYKGRIGIIGDPWYCRKDPVTQMFSRSRLPISNNTNNDMLNQSVQEMPYSEPSHFVEHSENEIHSDSNIIPYSQYLIESQNAAVQDINSSAQQDALILSVFEQLSNQEKEAKNIDTEIALEKKVKELNNILNRLSKDFGKCFVPQQELSEEQAFWIQTSHPNTNQSASSPVKIEAPRELPT
ncbi:hypothetical protein Tco_0079774, partial [Tanacetum coccineum]